MAVQVKFRFKGRELTVEVKSLIVLGRGAIEATRARPDGWKDVKTVVRETEGVFDLTRIPVIKTSKAGSWPTTLARPGELGVGVFEGAILCPPAYVAVLEEAWDKLKARGRVVGKVKVTQAGERSDWEKLSGMLDYPLKMV